MASPQANFLNRGEKAYVVSSPASARARAKMRHAAKEEGQRIAWMIGFLVSVCAALVLLLIFALQE